MTQSLWVVVVTPAVGGLVKVDVPVNEHEHQGQAVPVLVDVRVYPGGQVHRGGWGQSVRVPVFEVECGRHAH